jgi:hypothetical protein
MHFSQRKYNHSSPAAILAIDATKTVFEWIQTKKEVLDDPFFNLAPLSSKTYNQNALNELKWMMKVGDGE